MEKGKQAMLATPAPRYVDSPILINSSVYGDPPFDAWLLILVSTRFFIYIRKHFITET
jgi:hypothetical protein